MTSVCARCRAPLYGPVCQMCGARADAPAPAPGYMAYPSPYAMARQAPASRKIAVVGGLLSLVASVLVIATAGIALANSDATVEHDATAFLGIAIAVALATGIMGTLAIRGMWWASLTAGVLQSLQLFWTLACIGTIAEARKHLDLDLQRLHALKTLSVTFMLTLISTSLAMIFSYIGVGGARRWRASRASLQATDAFR